jgi:predicted ester cyclase
VEQATESGTDTASVTRSYFDAIARHDLDRMVAVWEPGSTDNLVGMAEVAVPAGLREWFGGIFAAFPDFGLEILDLVVEGESAAVRWRANGTFSGPGRFEGLAPTGASIEITGFDLLTVVDGKVRHNEAYLNAAELARQLGALPPAGSVQERAMTALLNLKTGITGRLRRRHQ